MGANQAGRGRSARILPIMALAMPLALGACTSAPLAPQAAMTCADSLPSAETGPYRPGIVCLAHAGTSPTTGARSAAADARQQMKAVGVDGRVFFIDARRNMPPEALLYR